MAIVPTYTAEGGIPAGGTGPQASPAAFAAPARALGGLGETVAQTGGQISSGMFKLAEIKKERRQQDDLFWAATEGEKYQEKLIEFYNQNKTDESLGEKYKAYAASLSSEMESAAPTPDAAKKFRLSASRTFNSGYGTALSTGDAVKLANVITSQNEAISRIGSIMESSDNPEEHMVHLNDRLAAVDSITWLSDSSKRNMRQAMFTGIAMRVSATHPEFAKMIVDGNSDIDADRQQELLQKISLIERSRATSDRLDYEQQWRSIQGAAIADGRAVDLPPYSHFAKAFTDTAEMNRWVKERTLERDKINGVIGISAGLLHLNPVARNKIAAERLATVDGAIRPDVKSAWEKQSKAIDTALDDDRAGVLMASDPELMAMDAAYQSFQKAEGRGIEAKRQYNAILKRRFIVQGTYDSKNPEHKGLSPQLFHNQPEASQRILTKAEASRYFGLLQQGNWEQRIQAVRLLREAMGNDRYFAVAAKDIEQMNPGDTNMIQKLMVANKLLEAGRKDLVVAIFSPDDKARELIADSTSETSKALKKRLELSNNGDPQWRQFAKAVRGSDEYGTDMVGGFRDAIQLAAASAMISPKDSVSSVNDAVSKAYANIIAPIVAVEDVPSYNMGGGYPMAIARDRMNQDTGNIDPMLGKRTSEDVRAIAHGLGRYVLDNVDPQNINLYDQFGDPLYSDVAGSAYKLKADGGKLDEKTAGTLRSYLHQRGVWVSTPDMQKAILHVIGKDGRMFAPTTKDNKHISVDYNELENIPYFDMNESLFRASPYGL